MAFVKVNKSSQGSSVHADEVRMGWHIQSERNKTRSIYLSMSRDVIDRVGWPIGSALAKDGTQTRIATRIAIHEGTGRDAGFLLVEHDPQGYSFGSTRVATKSNAAFTVNVSVTRFSHYAVNDILIEKEPQPVEFTIDEEEHTVLVEVPDWLRYNESLDPEPAVEEYVEPPPPKTKPKTSPVPLNRQQRRRLAKEVVTELGKH